MNLRDLGLILARTTLEGLGRDFATNVSTLSYLCRERNLRNWSHQPTDITYVNSEGIRNFKQSLLQESSGTM